MNEKDKMRVREAAAFFGVSEAFLRNSACARRLPHYKVGKLLFFSRAELEELITAGRVPARGER